MTTLKSKTQAFKIKVHSIVIGTDLKNNKQYILSMDPSEIVFPSFYLDNSNNTNTYNSVVEFLKNYVATNELELMPQLITLNDIVLSDKKSKNTINSVFSSVINYSDQINNAHWIEFDFLQENKYSNLIFQTIHQLK